MAKRNRKFDEAKIARWLKEGRGRGQGALYKPWLTVHDVASRGTSVRIRGWHTGRIHHLLSYLEYMCFLTLECEPFVKDIREQWVLKRSTTRDIARSLGIRHPRYLYTAVDVVMTTDFYITYERDGRVWHEAYFVKYSTELDRSRVWEKLRIEREYWRQRGIPFRIITEKEISRDLIFNMKLLHGRRAKQGLGVDDELICTIRAYLVPLLAYPSYRVLDAVRQCDNHFCLPTGRSMKVLLHLIATKQLKVELTKRIDPYQPLAFKKHQDVYVLSI